MDKEERLEARKARKILTKIKTLITPFPISNAVFGDDVRGAILRYMFPCSGNILKGVIRLGSKPKIVHEVTIDLSNHLRRYDIEERISNLIINTKISSGDCLTVSINSEEVIKEVWISFLWVPDKSEVVKENYYDNEEEVI